MKKKLLLISVLVASLSVSAFAAACGGDDTSPSTGEPTQTVEEKEYTITFNSLGGSAVEAQTYKTYQYLQAPEDPVREGFRFDGWYWNEDYSNEFIFEGNTMIPSDITVYAKWVEYYTLTFDTDGGSQVGDIIVEQGESATPPAAPSKSGYVFEGWFADSANNTPFDFNSVTSNATVYAGWHLLQSDIAITYYRNSPLVASDSATESGTQDEGTVIDESVAAEFEEDVNSSLAASGDVYVFNYWSLDREGRQPAGTTVPQSVGGELNLYAQWVVSSKYCILTFTGGTDGTLILYAQKNAALTPDQTALVEEYYGSAVTSFTAQDGTAFVLDSVVDRNLTLSPATTLSDFEFVAEGAGYKLAKYNGTDDYVTIPSSYNGLPVTTIGESAFTNAVTSVTIPDSVTSIGANAFANTRLQLIEGGRYVSSVGENAFAGCDAGRTFGGVLYLNEECRVVLDYVSGSSITIPSTVVAIAEGAFRDATALESVTFERGCAITNIPADAFNGCTMLRSVNLSAVAPLSVGDRAFENCTSLGQISLPSSVQSIGDYAFSGCTSLSQIGLGGVRTIGVYAFENCAISSLDLSSLRFSDIAEGAFRGCASLTEITLPETLVTIGARAFENCSALTTLTVNASSGARLTSIGANAFGGCYALRTLILFAQLNDGSVIDISGGVDAFGDCAEDLVIFVATGSPAYDASSPWYNAQQDAMYSYTEIYSQSYTGLTFLEGEATVPVITIPSHAVMYKQTSEKITENTDVLSLLLENGLTATDNGEGEVSFSIDSVNYITSAGSSALVSSGDGLYDLTDLGVYQVIVRATDRFGNSCFDVVRIAIVK